MLGQGRSRKVMFRLCEIIEGYERSKEGHVRLRKLEKVKENQIY